VPGGGGGKRKPEGTVYLQTGSREKVKRRGGNGKFQTSNENQMSTGEGQSFIYSGEERRAQ